MNTRAHTPNTFEPNTFEPGTSGPTVGHSNVEHSNVEQLELLTPAGLPVQHQLSVRTRRVGLAGIARARAILAEQTARRREAAEEASHLAPPHAA